MLWEKYCRFEEEKEWYRRKLSGSEIFSRFIPFEPYVTRQAFLEFEHSGSKSVRVPAKLISWPGLYFGMFWFLYKQQWLLSLILVLYYIVSLEIMGSASPIFWLHIFLGLAGNKFLELYLLRRGYNFKQILVRVREKRESYAGYSGRSEMKVTDTWLSYDEEGWKETRREEIEEPLRRQRTEEYARQREQEEEQEEAERKAFILEKMGRPKKTTD